MIVALKINTLANGAVLITSVKRGGLKQPDETETVAVVDWKQALRWIAKEEGIEISSLLPN